MKKTMLNCHMTSFEVLSVVLFSALTFGSASAAFAQDATRQSHEPAPAATFGPATGVQQAPAAQGSDAQAVFERADANRDGQLSAEEARQLPAISQRFTEMDTDRNGQLSRAEFDRGIRQH